MIKKDYTQDCLDIINLIIEKGKTYKKPSRQEVEIYFMDMLNQNPGWDTSVVSAALKAPKEVYIEMFGAEKISDPTFSWALWWAIEKGVVKHYGPGGTKGWTLHRSDQLFLTDVYVGSYSPFKPSSVMSHVDSVLKYANLVFEKSIQDQNEALQAIETKKTELESEKQYAQLQSKIKWG